jgi:hypothetical protein
LFLFKNINIIKIMNFIVSRTNYIPYYIPLIIQGNEMNIKSIFFLNKNKKKFVDPYEKIKDIQKLSQIYNFQILDIKDVSNYKGLTFFCEGDVVGFKGIFKDTGLYHLNEHHIKISLVCNYEFAMFYHQYINQVDYVIFPSEYYAQKYKTISTKNLYLGSPKYTSILSNSFNLPSEPNYCVLFFPKDPKKHCKHNTLYPNKKQLLNIYEYLKKLNFKIIVKSRAQDPVNDPDLKGDYYFEDNIYPTTSMELIHISKFAIYFSSSIVEECIFLKTPFIDFKVDQKKDRFNFLYNDNYSKKLKLNIEFENFKKNVNHILNFDSSIFDSIIQQYFPNQENVNLNIINYLKKNK